MTFGRPWRTGYGYWLPHYTSFALRFLTGRPTGHDGSAVLSDRLSNHDGNLLCHVAHCTNGDPLSLLPNAVFYPAVLLGLFWLFLPPLAGVVGVVGLATVRGRPQRSPRS